MRLLDLFCGAGGAAMGYYRAGFAEIVGVDIQPQPRYPFTFVHGDALEYFASHWADFDAVHASPPCQKYSWSARRWRNVERADLLEPTRSALDGVGIPWVIENVIGAPMKPAAVLCGTMFGLRVLRHRMFESNMFIWEPTHPRHRGTVSGGHYVTVAGHGGNNAKGHGGRKAKQDAMGIDWMNDKELNEAIPPAYTEYIGRQLIEQLRKSA